MDKATGIAMSVSLFINFSLTKLPSHSLSSSLYYLICTMELKGLANNREFTLCIQKP